MRIHRAVAGFLLPLALTAPASLAMAGPGYSAADDPVATRPLIVRGTTWYLRNVLTSGPATTTFSYGGSGDLPVSGDWTGQGTLTPGVVRGNTWYLRNSNTSGAADITFTYGNPGDIPIVGDWTGTGKFTPGVIRGNTWYLRNSNTSGAANLSFRYGDPGDRPTVGSWAGNGTYTPGVIRGNTWYLRNSNTSGTADVSFGYGNSGDLGLSNSSALIRDPGGHPLPASLVGRDLNVLPTSSKVVALTFDAGGDAAGLPKILAALQNAGIPATFFMTGNWINAFTQDARMIGLRYPVGDHTVSHPDLTTQSDAAVRDQILRAQSAIQASAKYNPQPLFRFPFGAEDARTLRIANSLGFASIRWTVDTLGWEGTSGGQSTSTVVSRVLANLRPGEIVLMHVGSNPNDHSTLDADALTTVISDLTARGYSFVTVPQSLP